MLNLLKLFFLTSLVILFSGCVSPIIPVKTYRYDVNAIINGVDYNLSREVTAAFVDDEWHLLTDAGPDWRSDIYKGFDGITTNNESFKIQPCNINFDFILFQPLNQFDKQRYKDGSYDSRVLIEVKTTANSKKYYEEFNAYATKSNHNEAHIKKSKIYLTSERNENYITYQNIKKYNYMIQHRYTVWKREFNRKYINEHLDLKVMIRDKEIPWINEKNEYKLYEYKYKNHPVDRGWPTIRGQRSDQHYYNHKYDHQYTQMFFNGEVWENNINENLVIYWVPIENQHLIAKIKYSNKVFLIDFIGYIYDPQRDILMEFSVDNEDYISDITEISSK